MGGSPVLFIQDLQTTGSFARGDAHPCSHGGEVSYQQLQVALGKCGWLRGGSSASDRIWMALGEYGWLREGMDSPGGRRVHMALWGWG